MWPFSRKPKPLNPGPINEDWAYGDLAERITDGPWIGDRGTVDVGPENGDVRKVINVEPARSAMHGDGWYLQFGGFQGHYNAAELRKVPPLNSEADAEFTASIKALKPKRVRA